MEEFEQLVLKKVVAGKLSSYEPRLCDVHAQQKK